jgi:lysophospholipase L1-like esterase
LDATAVWAEPGFYLKEGDRVVFYGDSITDQRLYTTFVETYVITRFPRMNVVFVHSGIPGDRVTGGAAGPVEVRLQRDVFAYKPTVMTIMLGMNDGAYHAFDQKTFDTYAGGYRKVIETVKRELPDIRITVIQPSPYDDVTRPPTFEGGYNKVLVRYGDFLKDLGQKEQLAVADLNQPVVAALARAKALDAEAAQKILPDRVHPAPAGHLLLAEALLKTWNAPAIVTSVEIDAAGQRVVRADRTQITDLDLGQRISWVQADEALPMPLDVNDETIALVLRASDFVTALNQETLKVTGLTAARYSLKIDGRSVGSFTKEDLGEGVNLATLATPMSKQAADVHDLTIRHDLVHFARWRLVQVNLRNIPTIQGAHMHDAVEALDALEREVVEQQRAVARPDLHRYELEPQ